MKNNETTTVLYLQCKTFNQLLPFVFKPTKKSIGIRRCRSRVRYIYSLTSFFLGLHSHVLLYLSAQGFQSCQSRGERIYAVLVTKVEKCLLTVPFHKSLQLKLEPLSMNTKTSRKSFR